LGPNRFFYNKSNLKGAAMYFKNNGKKMDMLMRNCSFIDIFSPIGRITQGEFTSAESSKLVVDNLKNSFN